MFLSGCGHTIRVHKEAAARQKQWAAAVADHAMMSYISYHPESHSSAKTTSLPTVAEQLGKEDRDFLPQCQAILAERGWKWIDSYEGVRGEASSGLYFDVWEKSGPVHQIVFAFRGSERGDPGDWNTNARWFRPATPHSKVAVDQYHVVKDWVEKMRPVLEKRAGGREVRFSTTGHSLGGGLAQHAYYVMLPNADQSIVFDTSPVTGFRELDKKQRDKFLQSTYRSDFPSYRILRIHERGEILNYARVGASIAFEEDSLMRVVEFEVERGGNGFKRHSIARLTRGILAQGLEADAELVGKGDKE